MIKEQFFKHVKITPTCWVWTGRIDRYGYGKYKNTKIAHRISWQLHNGPIPHGKMILHHCDYPACVNPEHLFIGTHKDNTRDMLNKRRQAVGERIKTSKLKNNQIHEIRLRFANGESYTDLAKAYKVTNANIGCIIRRKTWKHVL